MAFQVLKCSFKKQGCSLFSTDQEKITFLGSPIWSHQIDWLWNKHSIWSRLLVLLWDSTTIWSDADWTTVHPARLEMWVSDVLCAFYLWVLCALVSPYGPKHPTCLLGTASISTVKSHLTRRLTCPVRALHPIPHTWVRAHLLLWPREGDLSQEALF